METRKWMGIAVVVLLSLWMTAQVVSGDKSTTSGILVQDEIRSGDIHVTGDVEFRQMIVI